jgi:4-hydroxybenzoate polyprenyltransferase
MLATERTTGTPTRDVPLIVDLDGTLIFSDLLWEAIVLFLKRHLLRAWLLPLWLLRGKAGFKHSVSDGVALDPAVLPYDQALLDTIRKEKESGREIVLATGAESRLARLVAGHVGLFDRVMSSDPGLNLTSHDKARALAALYGAGGYDYVGNSRADLPVWLGSRNAYSVSGKPFRLADGRSTIALGTRRGGTGPALLKALRPRQWLKNLLVFLPMLAGHALGIDALLASLFAFLTFSMCASSAYLLNDALDAQDDRLHPTKRKRPIANGSLPLGVAMVASPLLAAAALLLCAIHDRVLLLVVGVYFVTTVCYSIYLKRLMMVDIVVLAMLYTLRVLGGSAATGIEPSFWMLAFSFFLFLSLALLKRHSELANLQRIGKEKTNGRGYTTADHLPIGIMGANSAFVAIMVFMLYFNSDNVLMLYSRPHWLYGTIPLLAFWLGRLWILSFRGEVNEDPVLYVSKDKTSLLVMALCAVLAVIATV